MDGGQKMTKNRQSSSSDARHLLSVGLPLGIVLSVLILGAALQSGPATATSGGQSAVADPPLPPPASYGQSRSTVPSAAETPAPEATVRRPEPAPATLDGSGAISRLGRRAMADLGRLESSGDEWTSQVGVYCDPQRVSRLVALLEDASDLYVLPVLLEDRPCFRVCWGHYADHGRAKQARDLPAALRENGTFPQRISSVVQ